MVMFLFKYGKHVCICIVFTLYAILKFTMKKCLYTLYVLFLPYLHFEISVYILICIILPSMQF